MARRTFLFLQGLASPFMFSLAKRLRAEGHAVLRVNLSGADVMFWPGRAINFRDTPQRWPQFIARTLQDRHVSDLVLFGDCRPYHQVAIGAARRLGIALHIFEEGYFRPNWITLEHGGTNGYSGLPRNPEAIMELARQLPDPSPVIPLAGSFLNRALWDVTANVFGLLLWPVFPYYEWHGTDRPWVEYLGWLRRFARAPFVKRRTQRIIDRIVGGNMPYYLVPLQLHSDYQIRVHSLYGNPIDAVEDIMQSFARSAPPGTQLLFKLHPLDNGLFDYPGRISRIAERLAIADRTHLIDDGHLPTLLTQSRGVVTVNSSVATVAFGHGCAVKALGVATYDMPGLAYQGPLDAFWTAPTPPDADLFRAYRRVVMALTQINGGFFTATAIEIGTRLAAERILAAGTADPAPAAGAAPFTASRARA